MAKIKRICSVDGCGKPHYSLGKCKPHYTHEYYRKKAGPPPEYPAQKFLREAVSYTGDDCLLWPFQRNNKGYPVVWFGGRTTVASRAVCTLAHGAAPTPNLDARHSCGNGHNGCVNPRHLLWGTRKENVTDSLEHGTHPRQIFAKLNEEAVHGIRNDVRPTKTLAEEHGVHVVTINAIKRGRYWEGIN